MPEANIVFVAEGRIGNAAAVGAPTEREMVLGRSTASPEATADLAWANGSPVAFTVAYDPASRAVTFTVGGAEV